MKRNLIVLSNQSSPLRTALEGTYSLSSDYIIQESARTTQVDPENVLFIDANSFAESKIISSAPVKTALHKGIPIVITGASSTLLTALTGFGIEGTRAVIIVKGNGRIFYSKTFMVSDSSAESLGTESMLIPEDRRGEDRTDNLSVAKDIHPVVSLVEYDLPQSVIEDLGKLDEVESILENLAKSSWNDEAIPENRKWNYYWKPHWKKMTLGDPSGETDNQQTVGFAFSVTFHLLAADEPVRKKIFDVSVGGTGFVPVMEGKKLIRDDTKHRGWAQSLTYVEFEPTGYDFQFGNLEHYLPSNTADEVLVTTGYNWTVGFTGGKSKEGYEGSVNFSWSKNTSSSINTKDFRILTMPLGEAGMRFYHNTKLVGNDTVVDPREFGFFKKEEKLNDEMNKMFYYRVGPGTRVRSWPSLSTNTLQPGAECVWYVDPRETRIITFKFGGAQGLNYVFHRNGPHVQFAKHFCSVLNKLDTNLLILLSKVDYDDPVK